jgi:hypothetical protein
MMWAFLFMGYIQSEARNQSSLFPFSLDELIPDDHLVRVIEAYAAALSGTVRDDGSTTLHR